MRVYFASDHAGFGLKQSLIPFVRDMGFEVEDCGPSSLQDGDDFPDYVLPAARKVAQASGSFGIVVGASGQGEAMAANRIKGIRAAIYYGEAFGTQADANGNILNLIQSVRAHNDANVLSLGARFVTDAAAKSAVKMFLETPFSDDERHKRRIAKLDA
jgi:ribose 5-phosphate isomerase B